MVTVKNAQRGIAQFAMKQWIKISQVKRKTKNNKIIAEQSYFLMKYGIFFDEFII